ncbi:MAG: phosphate ABC transporter substrate-binding/OmpA family protein [Candidatus Electrothrix scaldis]|nr:MAG: phosphate ABC transporter substrate-binding/OmpA family protein [Candidatus Electrothrix sp. GW3-3]
MNKKITGALLLLVLGAGILIVIKLLLPGIVAEKQVNTSDAVKIKGKIRLALDNWIGYFPLRSNEMRTLMRREGWNLVWTDDKADYRARMEQLHKGEIDLAVATVDSYLLNGSAVNFPASIVAVIDESKGGDAIIARKKKAESLDSLKGKNDLKIAFTPDSPSHYLLKAAADHFNVPELLPRQKSNRIETAGSEGALKELLDGKADIAVLWEPDVSRALAERDIIKLLGTEDTERLIVDILLVNRDFMQDEPEAVHALLSSYFRVLKKYRDNPSLLEKDVVEETGLSRKTTQTMLKGVHWASLLENCETWFGINQGGAQSGGTAQEVISDTIESTAATLVNAGDFSSSPVPDQNPYRLLKSSFLQDLYTKGISGFTTPGADDAQGKNSLTAPFPLLEAAAWERLREVGTLKIEPIIFQHGSSELDLFAEEVLKKVVARLQHYPNFRIVVKGHTGLRGDPEQNRALSQQRADSVASFLVKKFHINPNRIRAVGYGADRPLSKLPGESKRTYEHRLLRVEIALVREDF